jgi:hypothetical protein
MEANGMTESKVEALLVKLVKQRGGLCYKFVSPGNAGVPDRIVIMPGGGVTFVELKTEIGRLQNIQRWQLDEMRKREARVVVLHGVDEVKEFVSNEI